MVMKGLPLAYAKDMQEDKEATFDALASLRLGVAAMTGMVEDLEPNAAGHAGGRRLPATPPPPTWQTGWCGASACPSARRTTSPAGSWPPRRPRASPSMRCRWRPCRPSSPRITDDVLLRPVGGQLGQEPHQLWGNGATERPQNGPRLDKAVGKGARKGLRRLVSASKRLAVSGADVGVADCEQGSTGQMHGRLRLAFAAGLAGAGRARPQRLRRARLAGGTAGREDRDGRCRPRHARRSRCRTGTLDPRSADPLTACTTSAMSAASSTRRT